MLENIWCDTCRIPFHIASIFIRTVLHDPNMYPDPDTFKPERFINPDGSLCEDPVLTSTFGFGKRICPGRHLADATLFIVVASLLSVFKIEKDNGGPADYPFTGSGVRYEHRDSLVMQETLRELTVFLVFLAHSPVRSPQGIEGQKSLSLPIPGFHELLGSFIVF